MTRAQIERLIHERAQLVEQMRTINDKTIAESREFSAEEQTEYERLEMRCDTATRQINEERPRSSFDARGVSAATATGLRSPVDDHSDRGERRPAALSRSQRMADWQAGRPAHPVFSPGDAREFSLGRAVRGMITGRWEDADLERSPRASTRAAAS